MKEGDEGRKERRKRGIKLEGKGKRGGGEGWNKKKRKERRGRRQKGGVQ